MVGGTRGLKRGEGGFWGGKRWLREIATLAENFPPDEIRQTPGFLFHNLWGYHSM